MSTITVDSAPSRDEADGSTAESAPDAASESEVGEVPPSDQSASGLTGTLFDRPSDPASNSEQNGSQDEPLGEWCYEPSAASGPSDDYQRDAEADLQSGTGDTRHSSLSHLNAQAVSGLKSLRDFLGSLRDWCHRHAAPRQDGDESELSWREALAETTARVAVVVRERHMRALIVLFLLCAGMYSTSGVPILGPSVDLAVWPLQAISVVFIWVGMTVPWARGHSFGSMSRNGALSGGESVDVLVPSVLLVALGGAAFFVSAMLMGAGSSSWGLFKVMVFFAVSALATATAAYETAAVSRRASRPPCDCEG